MNQLIPKYSFIKLFMSRVKNYNVDTYINHHIKKYNQFFHLNNIKVNMNLILREDYDCKKQITNSHFIKTHLQLLFNDHKIDELIKINYSNNHFKIDYNLKNNDSIIEKIDIPIFKVENNNYNILLNHYKFLDKTHNNEDYYKLFLNVQKKIEQ